VVLGEEHVLVGTLQKLQVAERLANLTEIHSVLLVVRRGYLVSTAHAARVHSEGGFDVVRAVHAGVMELAVVIDVYGIGCINPAVLILDCLLGLMGIFE
jgi:hypothetical protein